MLEFPDKITCQFDNLVQRLFIAAMNVVSDVYGKPHKYMINIGWVSTFRYQNLSLDSKAESI